MNHHTGPGITVTGIGRSAVAPDLMSVDLGISVLAASVAEGRALATERAQALVAALVERGVANDDIQTVRYSIHPEYDHGDGKQRLRGYRVGNELQVALRELGSAGEVLDHAADAGGDEVTISNVSFSVEDQTALRDQAREAAWNDARSRAEHLARLSGRTLGEVVDIVETTGRPPGPGPLQRLAFTAEESTPIEAGTMEITVTLEVRFGLG